MTGAVAAMAEPPQIEEPTPTSVAVLVGTFIILHKRKEISNEVEMVAKMIGRDCLPFEEYRSSSSQSRATQQQPVGFFGGEGDAGLNLILLFQQQG